MTTLTQVWDWEGQVCWVWVGSENDLTLLDWAGVCCAQVEFRVQVALEN